MSAPSCAISPAQTRVLLALVRVWQRDGRAEVRDVMVEADLSGVGTTHDHLVRLRDRGLVAWEPTLQGTLRPLVAPVPFQDGPR